MKLTCTLLFSGDIAVLAKDIATSSMTEPMLMELAEVEALETVSVDQAIAALSMDTVEKVLSTGKHINVQFI
jgi:hypothetical protein